MTKILWCGGSHLGNARTPILQTFEEFENDFYITAGPGNLAWARKGGRYEQNGTTVGGNGRSPTDYFDLAQYDHIVFVGHWIQPRRFFIGSQPLSSAVLDCMFPVNDFLIHIPGNIYNQPLELFPQIAIDKCILMCDPAPNFSSYVRAPLFAKKYFFEKAEEFCTLRGIKCLTQPETTLNTRLVTKSKFNKRENDYVHMNFEFWKSYLKKTRMYIIEKNNHG
ncbi:hypothetical protein PsAD5_02342 [Pseudovibrio sp. Ad5]|uniref:hypothetical protein n=1 Tax=Pseudovibrio sp. Ad5 TaxID=989436 RepID=UPI0007AEA500|nr:hypothetical protein [Pseudovibrio sp. Ad5]KZK97253.1 hypothetical protein PsAD5_02342 [Pseudovibrio sp. Ad5]